MISNRFVDIEQRRAEANKKRHEIAVQTNEVVQQMLFSCFDFHRPCLKKLFKPLFFPDLFLIVFR